MMGDKQQQSDASEQSGDGDGDGDGDVTRTNAVSSAVSNDDTFGNSVNIDTDSECADARTYLDDIVETVSVSVDTDTQLDVDDSKDTCIDACGTRDNNARLDASDIGATTDTLETSDIKKTDIVDAGDISDSDISDTFGSCHTDRKTHENTCAQHADDSVDIHENDRITDTDTICVTDTVVLLSDTECHCKPAAQGVVNMGFSDESPSLPLSSKMDKTCTVTQSVNGDTLVAVVTGVATESRKGELV